MGLESLLDDVWVRKFSDLKVSLVVCQRCASGSGFTYRPVVSGSENSTISRQPGFHSRSEDYLQVGAS